MFQTRKAFLGNSSLIFFISVLPIQFYQVKNEEVHHSNSSSTFPIHSKNPPCKNPTCLTQKKIFEHAAKQYDAGNLSIDSLNAISHLSGQKSKKTGKLLCPLSKEEIGHSTWNVLHTVAAYIPENPSEDEQKRIISFIEAFSHLYPCEVCQPDFRQFVIDFPPR
jgi:hypothetical protein